MNHTKPNWYFVDERVGCIAVRDRKHTNLNHLELRRDTPGVVQYWLGTKFSEKCPACGHEVAFDWVVPEASKAAADELCERLNSKG